VTLEDGSTSRHCIRTAHAEQNAINNAAREGVSLKGGTIYCKMVTCYKCTQSLINVGIVRVVAAKDYHASARSKEMMQQAGVELVVMSTEVENYKDQ
jgi:dCMP deaminase